ncbi:hypothetical protein ACFQVD_27910 [Streptosporangium amethystogenes subsp. fukuiense]|uniref:Uncharacterized protein n=1 Tax=Streptosporangium amethystogenes subsp. fukuiense TaxID=698418 RepID=A0ABW2T5K0_9ACTN
MRAGYNEALAMLGYLLGTIAATVLGEWAGENHRLGEAMTVSALLFQLAFLFGLVRLVLRGVRLLSRSSAHARTSVRRAPTPGS